MKWFKHMTSANRDEFIDDILDEFGLEGYARWWLILETIADQMDGSNRCGVTYSWVKWQSILRGKRNKLETFLKRLENVSGMNLKQTGNKLEINYPKLLIIRDEYSRKSGHTPGQSPAQEEREQSKESNTSSSAREGPGEFLPDNPPQESDRQESDRPPDNPIQPNNDQNIKYSMWVGWEPPPKVLTEILTVYGLSPSRITDAVLVEFVTHWAGGCLQQSDSQWVGKLVSRALKNKTQGGQPKPAAGKTFDRLTDRSWAEGGVLGH